MPKLFFKYCSICDNKFKPLGREQKKCDKCKEKGVIFKSFNRINKSLIPLKNRYLKLESSHIKIISEIEKSVKREINILKKELKLK